MTNFFQLFDLQKNADYAGTVKSISEGVSLRGYNLWLLLCGSMLASIGLNTNSAAIIIGAMLISPLMSPILGIGLSVAIADKRLLVRACRNLLVASVISLATSTCYFFITPLASVTEELHARTFPTLLDVLVALFGGIAGIISISRASPTNAIPGVAIATALMPPLCTAGFGIAKGDWQFFWGAFYLFFINAVFISMATFLIVKSLHFHQHKQNPKFPRYSYWFTLLTLLALVPSTYFLYSLYQKQVVREKVNRIVINPITNRGNEILKWDIETMDSAVLIKIYHSGKPLTDSLKAAIDSSLHANGLSRYHLAPMRVNLTKEEVENLSAEVTRQIFTDMQIRQLVKEKNEDTLTFKQVVGEVKAFLPKVDSASNGWMLVPKSGNKIDTLPVFFYFSSQNLTAREKEVLNRYLTLRFSRDSVIISGKRIEPSPARKIK